MADEDHLPTGGPGRAPRRLLQGRRGCLFFVVILLPLFAVLLSRLPATTDAGSLAFRGATALGIGLVLIVAVFRALRAFGAPPPAEPSAVDARTSEVVYECQVCSTRVRLEVAATGKPPRHCGEEMLPSLEPR